jgi:SAM-dependent methyltransferase
MVGRTSYSMPGMATDLPANDYVEKCLRGEDLFGDSFSPKEIEEWVRDEKEAYYKLAPRERAFYRYGYHAIDYLHGFSVLKDEFFRRALGIGSAYGDELRPIARRCKAITILEPSDGFVVKEIEGVPVDYVKPSPDGCLPFADDSFDLITCFSVLHHIPNVSDVVREVYRCLAPGGYALVREPTVSMGDWRKPRRGLTRRERGIPLKILRNIVQRSGFEIVRERQCVFPLIPRLRFIIKSPPYNNRICATADWILSLLPIRSRCYHPKYLYQKLRPQAAYFALRKQGPKRPNA